MPVRFDPTNREILRAELTRDEGIRFKTYRCTAGKLTIGVGRNLDDVGILPKELDELDIDLEHAKEHGITSKQAMGMLDNDIDRVINDLDRKLPWWRKLDEVRQRVMVNMAFNMGIGNERRGLCSFHNTLRYIREGQWSKAAIGMLYSKWAKQVGKRADRLADLMIKGNLQPSTH